MFWGKVWEGNLCTASTIQIRSHDRRVHDVLLCRRWTESEEDEEDDDDGESGGDRGGDDKNHDADEEDDDEDDDEDEEDDEDADDLRRTRQEVSCFLK